MGGALARALSKTTKNILIADFSQHAKLLAQDLGCKYGTNEEAVSRCERIFLGVKPQMMAAVLQPLQTELKARKPLLITMAAGIEIKKLEQLVGTSLPVIRIMPNTPVAVGKGMILYCKNELVTDEMLDDFLKDMEYAGTLDALDEHLIDAACSLSGCGPAFMYMFIEALADGAVACGLPRAKAISYATATMAGAAEMVLSSGKHPGQLKDEVCSPGGSTIAGVLALENGGFRAAVMNAVCDAFDKNKELGK